MSDDLMTETEEEKAGFAALQNETPFELVQPEAKPEETPEVKPEVAEEAKPEVKPEVKPEEAKKPVRLVPHEALHEERIKRQALERRIAELEKPKPAVAQPQGDSEEIDETQNPLGAIGQLKAKLRRFEEAEAEGRRQAAEGREVVTRMAPRVQAYKAEHPEYDDQVVFVRQSRARELLLLGMDEPTVAATLQHEEMDLARRVLANDMDPGAIMSELAKARGWRPKEPEPKKEEVVKPDAEAEKKIDRIAAGQKVAKSSSAGGGGGAEAEMTLAHLLTLEGAAFDKAFEKHGKRLMGG